MDKKLFENYKIEDFVTDESFISYHFCLSEKDRIFWEEWLKKNPSKKSIAREARQIIQSLSLTLSEKEYQDEFEKIKSAINDEQSKTVNQLLNWNDNSFPNRSKKRLIQYMIAAFLIVTAGAIFLFTSRTENKIAQLNETVNHGNKDMIITLSDSTIVTLSPNSTLKYPTSFQGNNRQVYLIGEAGFHVKRNEHFPFKVHTANIVTTVLGTIFNIKKPGDSAVVVELLKGKVKVEIENTTNASPILLNPEEEATYVFHDKHFYKNSTAAEVNVSFHQNSFEEIAARMKNVFGKTIINNSNKKNWRFTGEFKNTTAKDIIENICLIKNLKNKVIGDTIFINN
jgi:transmembrane sensor